MRWTSMTTMLLTLLLATAAPAGASFANGPQDPPGPVQRLEVPFVVSYVDADAGLVALGGPPPEQGCFEMGFEEHLADAQEVLLPNGVIVGVLHDADQPMQVYAASSIEEICEAVIAGGSLELLASGTVRVVATDNDLEVSLTRTNSFGHHATGRLFTPEGDACRFRGVARAQITRDGEFRLLKEDVVLNC